jgi:hypothetical protein
MTAFQAAELSYFYGLIESELNRVRFAELEKITDGNCKVDVMQWETALITGIGAGSVFFALSFEVGDFNVAESEEKVSGDKKNGTFYIPMYSGDRNSGYDRAYCTETITTMTEFAFDALKRIEAALAAYEMTVKQDYSL